jgi:7-cyano-7-deazaguanine synthase
MTKSVILLSGGLDSFVSLACAKEEYNIELALTFDYGQRASQKEISSSSEIAKYYKIEHKVINLPWLASITTTSLVNTAETLPQLDNSELDIMDVAQISAHKVWVPNRNGLFLNIAASFADTFAFTNIIFGANKEEASTFPDNSAVFIEKINQSLEYSTLAKPKVYSPLINHDKKGIVKLAIEHKIPFNLLRSCYTNEENHCGSCESCLRLKRALKEIADPAIYKLIFNN